VGSQHETSPGVDLQAAVDTLAVPPDGRNRRGGQADPLAAARVRVGWSDQNA